MPHPLDPRCFATLVEDIRNAFAQRAFVTSSHSLPNNIKP